MGRELKRVPLDFDWPVHKRWYGYLHSMCSGDCDECLHYARLKGLKIKDYGCPDFGCDPPKGIGYQLWETTSEGSPISPVFHTKEALAKYCEDNCTIFGSEKLSYDNWLIVFKTWGY